jgi:O-antigen ligase
MCMRVVSPRFNFTHAHNLFLQTAVNLGLVGLLVMVGLWGLVLWGLWQRQPQMSQVGKR